MIVWMPVKRVGRHSPTIGFDGCSLKTQFKGELLVALGIDGDETIVLHEHV